MLVKDGKGGSGEVEGRELVVVADLLGEFCCVNTGKKGDFFIC